MQASYQSGDRITINSGSPDSVPIVILGSTYDVECPPVGSYQHVTIKPVRGASGWLALYSASTTQLLQFYWLDTKLRWHTEFKSFDVPEGATLSLSDTGAVVICVDGFIFQSQTPKQPTESVYVADVVDMLKYLNCQLDKEGLIAAAELYKAELKEQATIEELQYEIDAYEKALSERDGLVRDYEERLVEMGETTERTVDELRKELGAKNAAYNNAEKLHDEIAKKLEELGTKYSNLCAAVRKYLELLDLGWWKRRKYVDDYVDFHTARKNMETFASIE